MSNKQSIAEVFIAEVYERDELEEMSDWFVFEHNVGFCSVNNQMCLRFEPDDIEKDKVVIKERFMAED